MQNIPTKANGSTLEAAEFNQIPDELENLITDTGQTPSSGDLNQLSKAAAIYASGGAMFTDSGAANTYVLSAIGVKKAPTAYFDGMTIFFRAGNRNTGSSTVNVATLGVKNLNREDGSNLSAGDILAGEYVAARYYNTGGYFVLLPNPRIDYAADSGAANAYVVALPVSRGALITGEHVRFVATNANTGASTLNLNGIGAVSIVRPGGHPLLAGDIAALQIVDVVYVGGSWVLVSQTGPGAADPRVDGVFVWVTTTTVKLQRVDGRMWIPIFEAQAAGQWGRLAIPTAGITATLGVTTTFTALASGTLYYVYAFASAGALAIMASTTGHSTDATTGIETMTGDATKTLVGMIIPDGSNSMSSELRVDSWANPIVRIGSVGYTGNFVQSNGTLTRLSTLDANAKEIGFASFSGRKISASFNANVSNASAGGAVFLGVGLDATTPTHPVSKVFHTAGAGDTLNGIDVLTSTGGLQALAGWGQNVTNNVTWYTPSYLTIMIGA